MSASQRKTCSTKSLSCGERQTLHFGPDWHCKGNVMTRFKATAEAVIGNLVLARYDDLRVSEDNHAEALREWFPIQTARPNILPEAATGSGYACHTDPGYHARPDPPAQVHDYLCFWSLAVSKSYSSSVHLLPNHPDTSCNPMHDQVAVC